MSDRIRKAVTRAVNEVNVPWMWRDRALRAEEALGEARLHMKLAERRLQDSGESKMEIVLRLNGQQVRSYWIRAYRIESASTSLDSGVTTWAGGDGSKFIIDVPISLEMDGVTVTP